MIQTLEKLYSFPHDSDLRKKINSALRGSDKTGFAVNYFFRKAKKKFSVHVSGCLYIAHVRLGQATDKNLPTRDFHVNM